MKDCVICSHGWRNAEGENSEKQPDHWPLTEGASCTPRPEMGARRRGRSSQRRGGGVQVAWGGGWLLLEKQQGRWGGEARGALRAEVIGLVEGPRMERTGEMRGKEVGRRRGWGVPCWGEEIWGKCCKRGARERRENGGVRARERKGAMWGLKLKWATYGKGEAHVGGKRRKRKGLREIRLLKKDCVLFRASLKSPSFTWHQT